MLKYRKRQLLETMSILQRANNSIQTAMTEGGQQALSILSDCQEMAIEIGTDLENRGAEGAEAVHLLEEYCELLYQQGMLLSEPDKFQKSTREIRKALQKTVNAIKFRLPKEKPEIVFLPYKASMWDSLESIWRAAKDAGECDVYVVPIPYFEKHPDGSFGTMHYEGEEFPEDVPIVSWQEYDVEGHRPEAVFIHNPYDHLNLMTSTAPEYYSDHLKPYTDTLIYVPYFAASGGMGEARRMCPAYLYADNIVIQSGKFRNYFDASLPDGKFLPFGSPKFDRVIRKCMNPPSPPAEWKERSAGKKVYFYNTSIREMLQDAPAFLKKMEYVFHCFAGREDACLLWRPHPLLENSFASMRPQDQPAYQKLKNYFIEEKLGIYDTTPDITDSIVFSDAYMGTMESSVTALFGIAGKPMFILNNFIDAVPKEDDWRGEIVADISPTESSRWLITQGNQLYVSPGNDRKYRYCCSLSEYAYGYYYYSYGRVWDAAYGSSAMVLDVGTKRYVCPFSAQEILLLGEHGVEKRIPLKRLSEKPAAFYRSMKYKQYLLLVPYYYPALVRYDTETDSLRYFTESIGLFHGNSDQEVEAGGVCIHKGKLYAASPKNDQIYCLEIESGRTEVLSVGNPQMQGCFWMVSHGEELWLLPWKGKRIIRWNPETGEYREYTKFPEGFQCIQPSSGIYCDKLPFHNPAFYGEMLYLPPLWGNMYVKLNIRTGTMTEWKLPFTEREPKGYYYTKKGSYFLSAESRENGKIAQLFSMKNRTIYEINLETDACRELPIHFDLEELRRQEPGFQKYSEWFPYGCQEGVFNTLPDFLDQKITGHPFDREAQLAAFGTIAANLDGSCGQKVYDFLSSKWKKTEKLG